MAWNIIIITEWTCEKNARGKVERLKGVGITSTRDKKNTGIPRNL